MSDSSLPAQGIPRKKEQKEGKSQRGQRAPRQQGPLNQHDLRVCKLVETEAARTGLHGSAPGPLCIYDAFMGFLHI